MPAPRPDVLDFLLTRRSRPAKTLAEPGPEREELEVLLTAAARSPDHGKLEPWRFLVIEGAARARLAASVAARMRASGEPEDTVAKQSASLTMGGAIVTVIASPRPSEKIPDWEQRLSAGAVCLALLNAALASGWGANWLTGWAASDRAFMEEELGLGAGEFVAGFIHMGTETAAPPERPRPDIAALTRWMDA